MDIGKPIYLNYILLFFYETEIKNLLYYLFHQFPTLFEVHRLQ